MFTRYSLYINFTYNTFPLNIPFSYCIVIFIVSALSIPANSCDNHSNPSELRYWTNLVQNEVLLVQYTHSTQQRSWTRMVQRHPKRSDQEWMELIQECRTSGLTDKAWCERNHIQRSSLYYHIR